MKKLLVLLTGLMLVSSLGMAQADPDENSFGVYFDTDGFVTAKTTVAPFEQVFAYLCVVNPTSTSISGWECQVLISNPAGFTASAWNLAAGTDYNPAADLFTVGIGIVPDAIAPINNVVVLATWSAYIFTPGAGDIQFTVYPFPGSVTFANNPGYVDGDDAGVIVPCGVSSGYPYGAPSAAINSPMEIIANEDLTWGSVKTLFQ